MPDNKEITIYDIARELDLSPSTVSRGLRSHSAIKLETIERIKKAASSMGYQQNTFASNLRRNRSNTIGVILPRFDSSFQSSVVSGIEKELTKRGYNLLISQSFESEEKEISNLKMLYNSRVDGLLLSLAVTTKTLDHLELFHRKRIPVVLFDRVREHPDMSFNVVVINNRKAGYDVTNHLIEQGCERILYLSDSLVSNVYNDRFEGYKQALDAHGLRFDPGMVMEDQLSEACGNRIVDHILTNEKRPDAIFAANDVSAVSVICALKDAGVSVPDDIAVAGFNNIHISRVIHPLLTTVNYPGEEMGQVASSMLIDILENNQPLGTRTFVLEHQLIVRESTLRKK